MKAIVIKFLNIRTGSPQILPNNNPGDIFLQPGDVIEIVAIVKGDVFKQNDVWYKLKEGGFVWSGGVGDVVDEPTRFNTYVAQCPNLINWNQSIRQLPHEWIQSKGKGVKVAVLDSGIFNKHEDFNNSISIYEDVTRIKDKVDYTGHGTHVAGIIGSRSQMANGLIGVAPACDLIIIKVIFDSNDGSPDNFQHIIDGLEIAKNNGADIINLSFKLAIGATDDENIRSKITAIRSKIKELSAANIAIVAAGGDNADMQSGQLFFPASCEEVIAVAAIDEGYFDVFPVVPAQLNFIGPSINYFSTYKESIFYQHQSGSSMVTAFISGILALAIAAGRQNDPQRSFTKKELISLLQQHAVAIPQLTYSSGEVFSYHAFKHLS